jgi:Flp pilus assembly protein TadG
MTTKRVAILRPPLWAELKRGWRDDHAAQIVEFALSLPLLILFVVGIFDFSNAITLKQKLTNAAREAARVAAADPASDLTNFSTLVPVSIGDAYQVVDNYLLSEKINDCGLSTATAPPPAGLTWTYTSSGNGCPGSGINVQINRGCTSPISTSNGTVTLIGTCVQITYAYAWEFNNVASSLGWTGSGPSSLVVKAGALNEN